MYVRDSMAGGFSVCNNENGEYELYGAQISTHVRG